MQGDLSLIRQELTKIAYLMTVRLFGDDAIMSKSGEIYRAAMHATTVDEIIKTGIQGSALNGMPNLFPASVPNVIPSPKNNEHALSCFIVGGNVTTAITLFGIFNAFYITPAIGFAASEATGEIIVIDASSSTLSSRSFLEAMVNICVR